MTEELEVLTTVARRLAAADIPYMVTGSIAVSYYSVPRMTRDIDVVVQLSLGDTERVCGIFDNDFYLDPGAVRQAIEQRGIFNIIHRAFVVKVDFVVRKESEYRREEFSRRRPVFVEGQDLFLVAPEDLIISKLEWAKDSRSEIQIGDVRNLLTLGPELDRAYLAHWVGRLGLQALYREAGG